MHERTPANDPMTLLLAFSAAARTRHQGLTSWSLKLQIHNMSLENPAPRRSTRIPLDVLVEVEGKGAAVYAGQTVNVNLHGALLRIAAPLGLGDRVAIHVHSTGKSASGTVVFAHPDTSQFGIELQTPENIWGVPPPPDWN